MGTTKVLDRARYNGLFDSVVVSNLAAQQADETLNQSLRCGATVTVETAKFVLDFNKTHKTEFMRRVYDGAKRANWFIQGTEPSTSGLETDLLTFACFGDGEIKGEWSAIPEMEIPENVLQHEEEKKKKEEREERKAKQREELGWKQRASNQAAPVPEPSAAGEEPQMVLAGSKQAGSSDSVSKLTKVETAVIERNPDKVTRRPRELLVKVRLPGVTSAAEVDVDVKGEEKSVRVDHLGANLHALVTLPFPVEDEKGTATFDPDANLLVLTLPVIVPKEDEQNALQHLEEDKAEPQGDIKGDENGEKGENQVCQDQAVIRAQGLRGMALPRKLCDNGIMF